MKPRTDPDLGRPTPVHTAKVVKQIFADTDIPFLTWPSQSPDLNPIENAWSWLKKRVASRVPRTYEEFEAVVKEEWAKLSADYCRKLIMSMPNRIGRIQANRGGHTGYLSRGDRLLSITVFPFLGLDNQI